MPIASIIRKVAPLATSVLALGLMLSITTPPMAMAGDVLRSGQLVGENKHVTTGKVTIEKDGNRTLVVLGPQFSLDGAPDPRLGFSKGGKFDKSTMFSKLKKLNGRQVYELPKSISVSNYDKFVVWCEKFSVSLGSAKLN